MRLRFHSGWHSVLYPLFMKPIIGLNLDIASGPSAVAKIDADYYEAIQASGGIPILIPPMPDDDLSDIFEQIDGLVLIGGRDYSPELYGEAPHEKTKKLDPKREDFDMRLTALAIEESKLPVLFICAGFQAANIVLGGSLIQDIASELPESPVKHSGQDGSKDRSRKHFIDITPKTRLAEIYGSTRINVPTNHHQAPKVLGRGLKFVGKAEDGIMEAFEMPDRPFAIGVQWHPERDYDTNACLFNELIREAKRATGDSK